MEKYVGDFKMVNVMDQARNSANGDKYGEFEDGKRHGQGTATLANGDKYVGEFKNTKVMDKAL